MPVISNFYGVLIRMYFRDNEKHKIPHLHANYNEYTAIFDLNGNIIQGKLPKDKIKIVQAWITIHNQELNYLWDLLVKGKKGFKIEPLK